MSALARPLKASMAALPVSPEVAPTMVMRLPLRFSDRCIRRESTCMATSLKAKVGPWKSSSAKRLGFSWTSGATAACAERLHRRRA